MAAVFLFIRQDLNRLIDQPGSLQKRSFCGANGILPPQPLGKPRHLKMARLFSHVFTFSMQTEVFRFRRV